jgi:hypothetical protein
MRPVYLKTQDTRLAGAERRLRFLERREQLPNPHTDDDLAGGGGGIQFDTTPQEGGFLEVTTSTGSISLDAETGIVLAGDDFALVQSDSGYIQVESQGISSGGLGILIRSYDSDAKVVIQSGSSGDIRIAAGGQIIMDGLPDFDPAVHGALWNDGGTMKISAG